MSPELFQIITQAGFGGLLVWLLVHTQRETARREDRLMRVLEKYGEQLNGVVRALSAINARLGDIDQRLEAIEYIEGPQE